MFLKSSSLLARSAHVVPIIVHVMSRCSSYQSTLVFTTRNYLNFIHRLFISKFQPSQLVSCNRLFTIKINHSKLKCLEREREGERESERL